MVKLFNLSHVNAFTALFILCYYHFLHLILSCPDLAIFFVEQLSMRYLGLI